MKPVNTMLFLITALFAGSTLHAGNTLTLTGTQTPVNDTAVITVSMENDSAIVAFQIDIPLPGQLTYIDTSAVFNAARVSDHILKAEVLAGDTLRIFGYSNNNTPFIGNSGTIVTFKLHCGTVPGDYSLTMNNPLMGDTSSTNIITGHTNGMVTILGPDIYLSVDTLYFGRVPLLDSNDQYLTIQNTGNQNLEIQSITFDTLYFSVTGAASFTIPPGQSQNLTVRFKPVVKGTYNNIMTVNSNDFDEGVSETGLKAVAYPVNELHTGNLNVYSGDYAVLDFTMNNMEPIVGIQFDLNLPESMTFVTDSLFLSNRKADHSLSANMISSNVLRVVAYSEDNLWFSGNDGLVFQLGFNIEGTGGWYGLNISNVVLGDTTGINGISASYNGYLQIAAADIGAPNSLYFGNVSIFDTIVKTLSINNYGQDTLAITQIQLSNSSFRCWQAFPVSILPWNSVSIDVVYGNQTEQADTGILKLFSNDPDESPFSVNLTGNAYVPNYISIKDSMYSASDTIYVDINVDNYEPFTGFQFDLHHPATLNGLSNNLLPGSQTTNHTLQASLLDSTTIRVVAYSMSGTEITGQHGTVISVPFLADSGEYGTMAMSIDSAVLGNAQMENILWGVTNNSITVARSQNIILDEGWNIFSINSMPYYPSMDSVLSDLINDTSLVKVQDEEGNFMQYIPGSGWMNTIGNVQLTEGYYIKVSETDTLNSEGNPATSPYTIPLQSGWNIMGYPLVNSQDALQAMQPIINNGSLYKLMDEKGGFIQYIQGIGWMNTIGNLEAGEGYYLKANVNTSITLTEPTFKTTTKLSKNIPPEYFSPVQGRLVYNPMNLVIKLENTGNNLFTEGDELAVFDGEFCVGAAVITNDKDYVTIVASMRDNPDLINGYNPGNNLKFKFWNHETNELYVGIIPQNQNNIDVFTPLETYIGLLSSNALGVNDKVLVNGSLKVIIAPNPVIEKLKLYYYLENNATVSISIYDVSGREVVKHDFGNQTKGVNVKIIYIQNLFKGIYIVKVAASFNGGKTVTNQQKFVKVK